MSEEAEAPPTIYKFYGIKSNTKNNLFSDYKHCETDRFWRRSIGQLNDKYSPESPMDECRNGYVPPRAVVDLDITDNLLRFDPLTRKVFLKTDTE